MLRFNDPAVSRKHLRFIRRQNEVFVEDLGSSNGTSLNGRRIAGALPLYDGDKVAFGNRVLTIFVSESELDDRPTLVLKSHNAVEADQPALVPLHALAGRETIKGPRAPTMPFAVVMPFEIPAHQRCPRCAAPVTELDDECSSCQFNWGNFRATTPTDVRPTPASITRRRHDRHQVSLRLVYASSELEIEALTRDLSESGVFVCSQVLDPVGTKCMLTILLDGAPPLRIQGIVRRVIEHVEESVEETGLGVQFLNVGHSELAWIRAVLARSSAA
jgi:hypothetical protein